MKHILLILFSMVLFESVYSQAGQGTYYAQFDSTITPGGSADSIWYAVPSSTGKPITMIQPYNGRNTWWVSVAADSVSGGYGDSIRATIELRLLPIGFNLVTGTQARYYSNIVDSQTIAAGAGTRWWDTGNTGGGQYYILIYAPAGAVLTRFRVNFNMRPLKD